MERFVVIGAGAMGTGIAYVAANAGYAVELVDVSTEQLESARATLEDLWGKAVDRGRMSTEDARAAQERVSRADRIQSGPAIVVEAVPERVDLKREVLAAAEAHEPALLASNTSSIPIGTLGALLRYPERFLGLHFFNPVWAMPLLEIVVGDATGESAVTQAKAVAAKLGKEPIVVKDMPGFATSRLGVALGLEAIRMLQDGVAEARDIDRAMVLGYKHPIGPLELTDLVGLDVRLDIARTLQEAYGDRFAPPPLLVRMVAEGRLGKKTGRGFYLWA